MSASRPSLIPVSEIEERLRDKVESLARELLPAARREGNYLKVGSVEGEEGQSLAVYLSGPRQGKWQDFAGDEHGDMLDLIQASLRLAEKRDAVAWAKRWLGLEDSFDGAAPTQSAEDKARRAEAARQRAEQRAQADAADKAKRIRGAVSLYLKGKPIAGTPAEAYLLGRGLDQGARPWPGALRFFGETWCSAERVKAPAMLAPIYLADGTHVATHRTWLQPCPRRGWTKLDTPVPKKVLGPLGGGFVPINKGASGKPMAKMREGEPVYVTEGIEDALVVRLKKPEARIVAAVSLGNIGAIVLPAAAKRLIVVADRDDNPRAQDALERAIARQQARGIDPELVMPPAGIKDLNEWLLRLGAGDARGVA